jgi:hypothetical protein
MSTNPKISLLDAFVAVAPYIRELLWFDVAVAVVDSATKTNQAIAQGKDINFPVKVGEPTPEKTNVMEVIRTNQRIVKKVEAAFGFPYLSIGIPIIEEDGTLSGGVSFNTSMELQSNVLQMATALDEVVKVVEEKNKQMTAKSQELYATGQHLSTLALKLKVGMEEGARQTNLLGLTTSIEAARSSREGQDPAAAAGETGVAPESRAEILKQIEEVKALVQKSQQNISNELINIISAILSVDGVASSQIALAEEIQESIEVVRDKSENLLTFAQKIMS